MQQPMLQYELGCMKICPLCFQTMSDTNRAVQPQDGNRLEVSDLESRGIVLST